MRFQVSIDLGNDNFQPDPSIAVGRILVQVAQAIVDRASLPLGSIAVRDENGNSCGLFGVNLFGEGN